MTTETLSTDETIAQIEELGAKMRAIREAVGTVIFGQDTVIDLTLTTLLSGGHAFLIGVPGLAKTSLVESMGSVLGLDAKRIQFTPDLMPSDVLGTEVMEETAARERTFRFIPGPIFTQLLMADEINRASPKTQSALLQAMQENHVTISGVRHDVPRPFHVLATQNPLEQEGTYPLPEAQLDRFLVQIDVDYPDADAERRMLHATTGGKARTLTTMFSGEELIAAQKLVRQMPVSDKVLEAESMLAYPGLRQGMTDSTNKGQRLLDQLAAMPPAVYLGDYRPTVQAQAVFDTISAEIDEQSTKFVEILSKDLAALNIKAEESSLPMIIV